MLLPVSKYISAHRLQTVEYLHKGKKSSRGQNRSKKVGREGGEGEVRGKKEKLRKYGRTEKREREKNVKPERTQAIPISMRLNIKSTLI